MPPAASWLAPLLHGWSCQIAARFNAPVYLVGSAVVEAEPRDVDVAVVLSDEAFVQRYGLSAVHMTQIGDARDMPEHRRYWQDVAKLTAWCMQHHMGGQLNLDLKIQDESEVAARRHSAEFRVRLDTLEVPAAAGSIYESERAERETVSVGRS